MGRWEKVRKRGGEVRREEGRGREGRDLWRGGHLPHELLATGGQLGKVTEEDRDTQ